MNFLASTPDARRSTWVLLAIHTEDDGNCGRITKWQLGVGNAEKLHETWSRRGRSLEGEQQVLLELYERLQGFRTEGTVLISPTPETIHCLRLQLLNLREVQTPSLRGFSHISISTILESNFADWIEADVCPTEFIDLYRNPNTLPESMWSRVDLEPLAVKALWQLRQVIGGLVPVRNLLGEPM